MAQHSDVPRLAYGLDEAARLSGLSVAFLRKLIRANEIKPTRLGRRVLISDQELKRFLGLEEESQSLSVNDHRSEESV